MIDIISLFKDHTIRHWTAGKNCTEGWVNIKCPLPHCGDRSNHLGINLAHGGYHCWHCGSTGTVFELLPALLECSTQEATRTVYNYSTDDVAPVRKQRRPPEAYRDILPKESTDVLPEMHREYLIGRGYSPELIRMKYKIRACGHLGNWKFRIIIPVLQDGVVVQFTALGIAGQEPHYRHCPNDQALRDMKSCIYNIDTVIDTAVIVEGALDAWRIGDGAVATFGVAFTDAQVLILARRVQRAFVLFDSAEKDPQAPKLATKLANQLSAHIQSVEVLDLDHGDPGDMSEHDVKTLRKEINL